MGTLRIGRVGLDVDLDDPQGVGYRGGADGRTVDISGYFRASSLTLTKALRSEILAQVGQLITITYDTDDGLNGVVILDDVRIDLDWNDGSLLNQGYFRFEITVTYIGSYSETEFQSLLAAVSAAEDFGTTPSYWHSPPAGARAYNAGNVSPTLISRTTEDGDIWVAYDIPAGSHPTWSVDPANYYAGAVEMWAGDRLRAGRDMPMDPTDWYLNNGLVQVRPSVYQGASDGVIQCRWFDGAAWGTWVGFYIKWSNSSDVDAYHYVSCLWNTPERATIRLVRDAFESSPTTAKHELDITLRRGGVFASFVYKYTGGAADHAIYRSTADAATRPSPASSYIKDSTLISGNRWVLGCPKAFTEDTVNGGLVLDVASREMPFFVGAAIGDAADASGDGPADLAEQYVGQVAEQVRAVRR